MSHDFPDGPDYNPEVIEDDPWDVNEVLPDLCPKCDAPWSGTTCGLPDCGWKLPSEAAEDELSAS